MKSNRILIKKYFFIFCYLLASIFLFKKIDLIALPENSELKIQEKEILEPEYKEKQKFQKIEYSQHLREQRGYFVKRDISGNQIEKVQIWNEKNNKKKEKNFD